MHIVTLTISLYVIVDYFFLFILHFRETQFIVDIVIKKKPEPSVHALDKKEEEKEEKEETKDKEEKKEKKEKNERYARRICFEENY